MAFRARGSDALINAVSKQQADEQYAQVQEAIKQQQNFVNAVNAQNGLQNQSNVYGQLQQVAAGQGPNPAQAQLANTTGQNVASQAALMASQRGSAANPGMLARQAAQVGGNIQQQAAGQAAALQAQQSLNAIGQAGNIANQQAAQQQQALNAYSSNALQGQSNILNALAGQNQVNAGMQQNMNSANAGIAGIVAKQQGDLANKFTGGVGSALGLFAQGGQVPGYEGGGIIGTIKEAFSDVGDYDEDYNRKSKKDTTEKKAPKFVRNSQQAQDMRQGMQGKAEGGLIEHYDHGGPVSKVAQHFQKSKAGVHPAEIVANAQSPSLFKPELPDAKQLFAKGGKVPALVSPGEQYLKPSDVEKVKEGKNPLSVGERIPGMPKHPGNDYRNDTVRRNLESGGIVIPNAIMQSKDAPSKAAAFVAAVMRDQSRKGK